MDADSLSLDDARDLIRAAARVNLSISNLEDQELRESQESARAFPSSASEQEDTEDDLSREFLHSEASEADISEIQHSLASIDSEPPLTETSVTDTSGLVDEHSEAISESISEAISEAVSEVISERASEVFSERTEPSVMSTSMSKESNVTKSKNVVAPRTEDFKIIKVGDEEFVDVRSLPLQPPRPAPVPEKPQRKCWHPVMLDTNPPPIIEEGTGDEEYPHKKTIRNLKKMIAEKKVTPTPETLIFFLCNKFAVSEEKAKKITV